MISISTFTTDPCEIDLLISQCLVPVTRRSTRRARATCQPCISHHILSVITAQTYHREHLGCKFRMFVGEQRIAKADIANGTEGWKWTKQHSSARSRGQRSVYLRRTYLGVSWNKLRIFRIYSSIASNSNVLRESPYSGITARLEHSLLSKTAKTTGR